MKRVKLILRDPDINKILGNELELWLDEQANIIDVIKKVDAMILERGKFPVKGCKSLLHMTFHPVERRFYRHVGLSVHSDAERFLDVRQNPSLRLPDNTVIVLTLTLCQGDWEQIIDAE